MKTIFTLLLASIFTTCAFAADEGRLTITVSTQKDVHVVIDNRTYRLDDDDNSLVLNNVRAGQHTIQVYRNRGNNRNNSNSRNSRNNRNDILYSSTVYVRPNYDVDIMINRFGKAFVDERDLRYSNDDWRNNGNYGNGGYGNGGYGNGNNNGYNQAMNENDFNQLLQKTAINGLERLQLQGMASTKIILLFTRCVKSCRFFLQKATNWSWRNLLTAIR
jgi:hypothetical protein